MTLFRKVFQHQSRPATEGEAPDEAALRSAFKDNDFSKGPLILDPFEHAAKSQRLDPDAIYDDETYEDDGLADEDGEDSSQGNGTVKTMPDVSDTDFHRPEEGGIPGQGDPREDDTDDMDAFLEAPDSNLMPQSDEEIAAFLGRAIALDTASDSEAAHGSEQGDTDQADDEEDEGQEAADLSDDLDFASFDALDEDEPEDPDCSHTAPEEQKGAAPCVAEAADDEAADDDTDADEVDLAAFARTQMTGIASQSTAPSEVASLDDRREAARATEQVKGPGTDGLPATPAVDLSAGLALDAELTPAAGRTGRRAGRVKTRLLGFNHSVEESDDPFDGVSGSTATAQREKFPVGWLVVVEGPGVGHAFSIFTGASVIGRGEDQMIRLDFGDNSISRNNHAAIAYDEEANKFYIGHGGKSNIIRRNARPVLSTEELHHADLLRIGETTLRFVALCGSDFQWHKGGGENASSI